MRVLHNGFVGRAAGEEEQQEKKINPKGANAMIHRGHLKDLNSSLQEKCANAKCLTTRWHLLKHFETMRNGSHDETEAFDRAAGFAGEANHQGFFHDRGEVAREDCVLRDFHRFSAHDFAETRQFTYGDFADSFGGYV